MRCILFAVVLSLAALTTGAQAGLKVYYLRHAESGANVEKQWKDVPRDQWPPYVGNADTFSPLGVSQLPGVLDKLEKLHFDFIAVSPLWRTRHTILPYLQRSGRTAEIWPEMAEFKPRGKDDVLPGKLPPPSADLLTGGGPFVLPQDERPFFKPPGASATLCKIGEDPAQAEADRQALVGTVISRLRERFGGADKSVLLVGHGTAGRLLASILANDPRVMAPGNHMLNARLWLAEEQADGSFRLVLFNDEPWAVE